MHGSRKPRLPIQAQNLIHQYPEDSTLGEWAGDYQIEELVDVFMYETQEFNRNKAGEHLSHSQTLMKQQYDKKVNPIAFSKIENGDNVLDQTNTITNMSDP
ncbi:hypothetical protein LOD99_10994 [Oopsacas minuta]|uniref:Uncharacterized protein n=1 Tax=Oopsacas minuta TaxID=111878 RepID=A0AAV7KBX0_9METZ|nr:hypothetical protein LOD99_10994 [Oopsacas minuta]